MVRLDAPVFTGGGRLQDEKLGCLDIEFNPVRNVRHATRPLLVWQANEDSDE
jgi:hypothetical protein